MNRKAFTLIEVLVVVSIIAILIAILLPSLKRAQEMSRRTVCLHNLKMLGQCWILYYTDNKGALVAGVADAREITDKDWLKTHAPGWTKYIGTTPNSEPVSRQVWAIRTGGLYKYTRTEEIYLAAVPQFRHGSQHGWLAGATGIYGEKQGSKI